MEDLLVKDLHAGYGEVDIISDINLFVGKGQIVTIAGTNGAGKSSLVKAIMGLLPHVRGEILVRGRNIISEPVERRLFCGIGYVPQVNNVFGSLTVVENLKVVEGVSDQQGKIEQMFDLFPVLKERARMVAGHLSGGERQQLTFARALMSSPDLLLLDEPSAALSPALVEQVFARVQSLAKLGIAILMVEQRARQALSFSDYGYILDGGRTVLSGSAQDLLNNDDMARLYLGAKEA